MTGLGPEGEDELHLAKQRKKTEQRLAREKKLDKIKLDDPPLEGAPSRQKPLYYDFSKPFVP